MTFERTDSTGNEEAIATEQPIAASPGPMFERKAQRGWRSWGTLAFVLVVFAVLLAALQRSGAF